ncbi:MAG TPA: hypothetical protein VFQ12_12260 [Thermoleophilaceae bacterium]|nr:hypothetical protein [Thermoleophilaceae bacterium]
MPDRVKRFLLAALMALLVLNLWTGGPLLALWLGSRVQGTGPPTMGAIGVVILALGAISFGLYRALQAASAAYDEVTGAAPTVRQHAPWLRSMRGERTQYEGVRPELSNGERILVLGVIAAFAAFEIWFFFFSGSPIGAG